jgi:AbrB family looped-hinge helix DNA binding protein
MKTTVSTKGKIILPAEIRQRDGIEPGQIFEVERVNPRRIPAEANSAATQ